MIFVLLLPIYFLPSIIAASRRIPNVGSVIVVNWLLGWTLLGWVVAFAMACVSSSNTHHYHYYHH